jgi:cyclic pyranopterin phosphate synthase
MPEEGIDYVDKGELLTYEEMLRMTQLLAGVGISKVRITGGEPFIRKDMMSFLQAVCDIPGIEDVHITTNGTTSAALIPELKYTSSFPFDRLRSERRV